tara:strand:+ start:8362 stop:9330 length:969 start_codon:yes stop_codon:yes gene_type:complete
VSSQIVETNPTSGSATTSSVRNNFGFAKTEIQEIQRMSEDVVVTTGDYDVQVADFSQNVVLAEGVRISIEVGSLSGGTNNANDTTTPTLNVDSTGAKTIVRQDGSALVAGDLKAGQYCDLIYDSTATVWVWLNSNSSSANLASPSLTSPTISGGTISGNPDFTGAPTATTAAVDTNTTQIATTAFVQAQTATDARKGIAELATAAEVKAGTDAERILTAANLLRVAVSNDAVSSDGDQGSIEIAGVIIKWGLETSTIDADETFTFDTPFPNGCSCLITQIKLAGTRDAATTGLKSVSASNFVIDRNNDFSGSFPFYFLAIGR